CLLSVFGVSSYYSGDLCDLPSFPTRRSSDRSSTEAQIGFSISMGTPASATRSAVSTWYGVGTQMLTASATPRIASSEPATVAPRSEEHTSELQSRENLVCRLLLEKKNHEPS